MNKFFFILLIWGISLNAVAQQTARERLTQRQQTSKTSRQATTPSVRAQQMSRQQAELDDRLTWSRIIYRYIDLSKEENAPLLYPSHSTPQQMNLFHLLFRLLENKAIKAYEYLDGREDFSDDYQIDFPSFVERFDIYHIANEEGNLVFDDADIPSSQIVGYYVKEQYGFNASKGDFRVKPIAICPVMRQLSDYEGSSTRYPLFWIPFDSLMPYAMRIPMMTSSLNNSEQGSIADFFIQRRYKGEIYKAQNGRNMGVVQLTGSAEERQKMQDAIEKELKDFQTQLWEETDSVKTDTAIKSKRNKIATTRNQHESSTTYSMRNRRY